MFTLHRSPHFTMEHWQASRYVRLVRSAVLFRSPDEAGEALKECGPLSTDPRLHQFVTSRNQIA